ncbi:MAG: hypothetical protein LBQ88_12125 [Treponema sp.]|jgi:hypothetical protein|nr:hypothetical protein [Treponema sp.]
MGKKKTGTLADTLKEQFADPWKLLSETTVFLSRVGELHAWEAQLRGWRSALQSSPKNHHVIQDIRREITEFRKNLRRQGYDLSLAGQNLILEGFRNDASLAEGFTRLVLFIVREYAGAKPCEKIVYITGDDNHVTLAGFLEKRLERSAPGERSDILERHYLWYRRRGPDIVISGADTETKPDFERFEALCAVKSFFFLGALKQLR